MLDEILESTKQSLLERLNNPLISSFVISWCLWNWKFLIIVFSNNTVTQTFSLAEHIAFPTPTSYLLQGFLYPLLSSLLYIFALPYPSKVVYSFSLHQQQQTNKLKQKIQNETLLSVEDSIKLKEEMREYDKKSKEVIKKLNDEISSLSLQLESNKTNEQIGYGKTKNQLISEEQISILKIISSVKDTINKNSVIANLKLPLVNAEFEIEELVKMGLINSSINFNGDTLLSLSHEGRRAYIQTINNTQSQ